MVDVPGNVANALGQSTASETANAIAMVGAGNISLLVGAIVLIIIAVLLVLLLKRIIVNSLLGIVAWAIVKYIFGIQLPFWASLIVSAIFGLAGIGAMLILRFLRLL